MLFPSWDVSFLEGGDVAVVEVVVVVVAVTEVVEFVVAAVVAVAVVMIVTVVTAEVAPVEVWQFPVVEELTEEAEEQVTVPSVVPGD